MYQFFWVSLCYLYPGKYFSVLTTLRGLQVTFFNNCILCLGENIVKGDKESIKNLLEIFDGLLEYLTEHISETSHERSKFAGRGLFGTWSCMLFACVS